MVTESVMEDYRDKTRSELKMTASIARDARRELRRGNFKIALAQAQEAEMHIQEAKTLLKEMTHLTDLEKTSNDVRRATMLTQEINEKEKELEELEKQLIQVKEAASKETKPEAMKEEEEEPETKV